MLCMHIRNTNLPFVNFKVEKKMSLFADKMEIST